MQTRFARFSEQYLVTEGRCNKAPLALGALVILSCSALACTASDSSSSTGDDGGGNSNVDSSVLPGHDSGSNPGSDSGGTTQRDSGTPPLQDSGSDDSSQPSQDSGSGDDGGQPSDDSSTSDAECPPPGDDGGAWPSDPIGDGGGIYHYTAEYPIYYPCTPTPPVVTMDPMCSDPTVGYKEYRDTFHVEWGINVPDFSNRFDLVGGIYNFMVGSGDGKHSQSANGTTPRTEAAFGAWHDAVNLPLGTGNNTGLGTFNSSSPDPDRIYSADWYLDSSADGTVVFQLHTIAASGSGASIYINNCPVPAGQNINSNNSGDTNYYFKNGLYKCTSLSAPLDQGPTGVGGCNRQVKNIHLYSR